MLRHPDASSHRRRLRQAPPSKTSSPTIDVTDPRRLLVCTGKIGHNLRVERAKRKTRRVAIIFVDSSTPGPKPSSQPPSTSIPTPHEIVWVQEEPANMGALHLRHAAAPPSRRQPRRPQRQAHRHCLPRNRSAKAHEIEEKTLIDLALGSAS